MAITYVGEGTTRVIYDDYDFPGEPPDPIYIDMPDNTEIGDLLIMLVKSSSSYTPNVPGWTTLSGFPAQIGTDPRLTVLYRVATVNNAASVQVNFSTTLYMAMFKVFAFRGVDTTNPIHTNEGPYDQLAPYITAMTFEGTTTSVPGCMVINALANARSITSTAQYSSWANASLASITEICDDSSAVNNGGGLGMACGIKVAAGAVNGTTATRASSSESVLGVTFSLTPIPEANSGNFLQFLM